MSASGPRQMHLGVFAVGNGNHVAGWRHPGAAKSGDDIGNYIDIARRAEAAAMDLVFLADNVRCDLGDHPGFASRTEPFTTLSAVAVHTRRIGLVASGSTSYTEPYNLARFVASLDHISAGRAGWNLVTTNTPASAENFGVELVAHDERYAIASEYIEVVKGLWDGWEPGATLLDVQSGRFFDPARVHELGHRGKYFSVRGPLNVSRCPQGQPVIFQAGSSRAGQAFAARHADVVLAVQINFGLARAFYTSLKRDVSANGRDPCHCKILPGFLPVVGSTEAEAKAKLDTLASYVDESVGFRTMTDRIGHDFSSYPSRRPDTGPSPAGGSPGLRTHDAYARVPRHAHAARPLQQLRGVAGVPDLLRHAGADRRHHGSLVHRRRLRRVHRRPRALPRSARRLHSRRPAGSPGA